MSDADQRARALEQAKQGGTSIKPKRKRKRIMYRDAITGETVTRAYARLNPDTTVREER